MWDHLPNDREAFLKAQQAFFDEVTQTSGKLFPFPKDERKAQAVKILKNIHVPRKVTPPGLTKAYCPLFAGRHSQCTLLDMRIVIPSAYLYTSCWYPLQREVVEGGLCAL